MGDLWDVLGSVVGGRDGSYNERANIESGTEEIEREATEMELAGGVMQVRGARSEATSCHSNS